MPDPIIQQVRVEYDGSGAAEAAEAIKQVDQTTAQASQSVEKSAAASARSAAVEGQRVEQLDAVESEVRQLQQATDQATQTTQRSTEATSRAVNAEERRAERLKALEERMVATVARSLQLEDRQRQGGHLNDAEAAELQRLGERRDRLARVIASEEDRRHRLNRTVRESIEAKRRETAEDQQSIAAGESKIAMLLRMAAPYASLALVINKATEALREFRREQDEAGRAEREARRGLSSLAQLSETPDQFNALVEAAKETFKEGGARSLDEAARVVFALESAGQLDQRKLFSELAAKGILGDTDTLANSVAALIASIGEQETGTARDIVSKGFGASKFAPSSVTELLSGAARAGVAASRLELSDEELLAAVTVVSKATGSADQAGTYVRGLLQSLGQIGEFKGKSLLDSVAEIEAKGLNDADLTKYLGREEALTAFGLLAQNRPLYNQTLAEISRAQSIDATGVKLSLPDTLPGLVAARQAERQEAERQAQSVEQFGVMENLADALVEERIRAMRERNAAEVNVQVFKLNAGFQRFAYGNRRFLRTNTMMFQGDAGPIDPELNAEIQAALAGEQAQREPSTPPPPSEQPRPIAAPAPQPASRDVGRRSAQDDFEDLLRQLRGGDWSDARRPAVVNDHSTHYHGTVIRGRTDPMADVPSESDVAPSYP